LFDCRLSGRAFAPAASRPRERASDDIQLCDNSTNDPDEGMPACTRIINGSQTSKLETIFNNRANAWFRKKVTIEHVHVHECRQAIVGNVGGWDTD
jgi:hypothetical protein